MDSLDLDCLESILSFLPSQKVGSLRRLSKGFKDTLDSESRFWSCLHITGHTKCVKRLLGGLLQRFHRPGSPSKRTTIGRSLFIYHLKLSKNEDERDASSVDGENFKVSFESFLIVFGPGVRNLYLCDDDISFLYGNFSGALFGAMSDSLRFLKKVWIGGQVESVYLDDTLLLSLMMKNPTVDTFVDAQAFGLSHWGLMHALDNWSNISRLELNTEFLRVRQFSGTMAKFKNRLKHLKFTHFTEPLDNQRVEDLGRGLARLSNLELLEMDWEMTNHRDGLVAQQVSQLLSRMLPSLRRFVYTVPIDAYFEDIAEEASGNQANLLPSPLSAGPVNQLSHGTLPEGVPIQLLSSSLSRSFPILRLRSGHSTRMSSRSGATTREPNDGLLSPSSPSATTSSNPRKQKESEYFGILKGIEGLSHLFPVDITVLWSVD